LVCKTAPGVDPIKIEGVGPSGNPLELKYLKFQEKATYNIGMAIKIRNIHIISQLIDFTNYNTI
jgi:hypothetical protein